MLGANETVPDIPSEEKQSIFVLEVLMLCIKTLAIYQIAAIKRDFFRVLIPKIILIL